MMMILRLRFLRGSYTVRTVCESRHSEQESRSSENIRTPTTRCPVARDFHRVSVVQYELGRIEGQNCHSI
jgi:hypothetical protein